MKAVVAKAVGREAQLETVELPIPVPQAGQVLIEVRASSLNPIDNVFLRMELEGMSPELPAVLHGDVAGVISTVGPGVEAFAVGDEVYGCAGGFRGHRGALADYMLADVSLLAPKPASLDFPQAAVLPLVTITAWEGLIDRADIQAGQHALIHGGCGGVGHVALQIAKAKGARVATTVSSHAKATIACDLGADDIINYRQESVEQYVERLTGGAGFDIVYDTVGGGVLDQSFRAARKKGQVINILGFNSHDLSPAFRKGLTLHMENMTLPLLTGAGRAGQGEILRQAADLVEAGKLKPLLDPHLFTFDQANEAHALYESRKHVGKIVLTHD
ncbi:MAG: zinc-dependent alcohol dehydrogenase family protein [Phycisphaerae bacterium]|jgi:NADPH2:quinone reductase|nr:zinc-dependent alcohol dehydrogenase family protein [Phycisphaerae bacterium]